MGATLNSAVVDGAPGNALVIAGSDLFGGPGTGVMLASQGVSAPPGLTPATISLPATFAADGSSVTVTIPDGVMDGLLTVTANDGSTSSGHTTTATCSLRAVSQYVTAAEYIGAGEGVDVSTITTAELDKILQRASDYADTYMGSPIRQQQILERHKYHARQESPPKVFPWRTKGRRVPIISLDQLLFVSAPSIVTSFNVSTDVYVNQDLGYFEILAYAIGNYALLGALEIIGYSANTLFVAYTYGYPVEKYPGEVRAAVTTIATELLTYRRIQQQGLGGLSRVRQGTQQYERRQEPFAIPSEAKQLLRRYVAVTAG